MPKIDVPIREVEDVKKLAKDKQFMQDAARLVKISARVRRYEEELHGTKEEPGLRSRVFQKLDAALDGEEKSVALDGYRITKMQGSPRRTLDVKKLLKYIPADKLEKCYTLGEPPRPTVQVAKLESHEDKIVRKVTRTLVTGDFDD